MTGVQTCALPISSTWAYVGVGVVAVVAGVAIGYAASRPTIVDCATEACR